MIRWLKRMREWLGGVIPGTRYVRRLVWLGCVSVSLPVIILGTAYYQFSMNKLKAQLEESSLASLHQLKERMENAFTSIEYQSMQLALNPLLVSSLGQSDYAQQYVKQKELLEYLEVQKNSSSLIDDIVFYDAASNRVLANSYGAARLADSPQLPNIRAVQDMQAKEGWFYLPNFAKDGSISYVRQLPVMNANAGQAKGLLIIQVKERAIRQVLFNSGAAGGFGGSQTMLVLDAQHRILLHSDDSSLLGRSADDNKLLAAILAQPEPSRQFTLKDGSGKRVLALAVTTALNQTYISIVPEQEMTDQLVWMRFSIVFTVLVILLFGIVLTVASSRFAFSPIDKLIKYGVQLRPSGPSGTPGRGENEIDFIRSSLTYLNEQADSLNRYIERIQPDLREQFLLRLLDAGTDFKPQAIADEIRKFHLPEEGCFTVLVVKVDNLFKEKRFLPSDGPVIVFAVQNVMQELLSREAAFSGYVLGKQDKEVAAILHFAAAYDHQEMDARLAVYAEQVCEGLKSSLSFTVSIGVSAPRSGPAQLPGAYKEALQALRGRLFDDSRRVFRFAPPTAAAERLSTFNYPKETELAITEHLLQGELEPAVQALQTFHRLVRLSDSYDTAMQCYQILLSSIIQSLEEMGYGILDSLGDNLFEQLKARQTYREVHEWFAETLFPMHRQITDAIRSNATKLAVQKVCQYMEANQGMPSLIECAELVSMSPSYLSRMFKQEVGMTFIEYLMKYKVDRAKKLLAETDHSITQIAEMIGYSERNLNRAFQRHVLMSPKQYRLSVR